MHIRNAEKSDIEALSVLAISTFTDSFQSAYNAKDMALYLEAKCSPRYFSQAVGRDTILIAEENHRMIGYLKYGEAGLPVEGLSEKDIELHRLYVLAPYRGKGVGTQLIEAFLSRPDVKAVPNIYLGVRESNTRAQALYRHYGFEVIGEYDYYVGEYADHEWIMVRRGNR